MTDVDVVAQLTDLQTLALTLYGEARSEPIEGRIAIANVIRNRVSASRPSFGLSLKGVCLKAWQFSCWLPGGGKENYEHLMKIARQVWTEERQQHPAPILRECFWIADGLIANQFRDNTEGATHYCTFKLWKENPPAWTKGHRPVTTVGDHVFFAGVR